VENNLKVKKRDTSLEPFDFDKLLASITKAGVPIKDAIEVARDIEGWVKVSSKNSIISSIELRDKIVEKLSENFPSQAESYRIYKKF